MSAVFDFDRALKKPATQTVLVSADEADEDRGNVEVSLFNPNLQTFYSALSDQFREASTRFMAQLFKAQQQFVLSGVGSTSLPVPLALNTQAIQQAGFSNATLKRIEYLAHLEVGWYGDSGQTLNPLSLRNFLNFWVLIKENAVEPELSLSTNGNIQAEWFKSASKNLSVEFRHSDAIYILQDGTRYVPAVDDLENLHATLSQRKPSPFKWFS